MSLALSVSIIVFRNLLGSTADSNFSKIRLYCMWTYFHIFFIISFVSFSNPFLVTAEIGTEFFGTFLGIFLRLSILFRTFMRGLFSQLRSFKISSTTLIFSSTSGSERSMTWRIKSASRASSRVAWKDWIKK